MSAKHDDLYPAIAERQGDPLRGFHGDDPGYAPTEPMPLPSAWEPTEPVPLAPNYEPTMPAPLRRR